MNTLVQALGWRETVLSQMRLVAIVVGTTLGFLLLGVLLIDGAGLSPILVQLGSWGLWFVWLGFLFPRNHPGTELVSSRLPYRGPFLREILPGIGCSFAQLSRPVLAGLLAGGPLYNSSLILPGALLTIAGGALIYTGVGALGVARTLFVHEYISSGDNVPLRGFIFRDRLILSNIYSYIRHPLFVGGICASVGLGLLAGTPQALHLAALNVCMLPAYVFFEDRRCCQIIGKAYVDYRRTVGGVAPRPKRLTVRRSGPAHRVSDQPSQRVERCRPDMLPAHSTKVASTLVDRPISGTADAVGYQRADQWACLCKRTVERLGRMLQSVREPRQRPAGRKYSKDGWRRLAARKQPTIGSDSVGRAQVLHARQPGEQTLALQALDLNRTQMVPAVPCDKHRQGASAEATGPVIEHDDPGISVCRLIFQRAK